MVVAGRRKSIALYIALCAGLILVSVLLYVGWVLLSWRSGALLFLGVLLLAALISGVVLNTFVLVREIRRNEQQDAFINAVTHELKTPVASIRLYLETLQSREVDAAKRKEFYATMLEDSDRLLETIELGNRNNWAEDLLLEDSHVVGAFEDGWLNVEATG